MPLPAHVTPLPHTVRTHLELPRLLPFTPTEGEAETPTAHPPPGAWMEEQGAEGGLPAPQMRNPPGTQTRPAFARANPSILPLPPNPCVPHDLLIMAHTPVIMIIQLPAIPWVETLN